ncbi:MAG: SHOCT domain-containing protein [Pseudomonadales bacterium]|nr:SHOCT domain-containing protein [Halioglobus sp.]MCP5121651.1 SHOCT domain-containing protein [Pseudomonadales bacterium]MCP5194304.1 SHOCT domain-containing protein [Pseudomonadales bacterium]
MLKTTLTALSTAILCLSLSACGGSTTKTVVEQKETQGQQLLDLKEAYDKGVITESEYKRTKNEILKDN